MSANWEFFVDEKDYGFRADVLIRRETPDGLEFAEPLQFRAVEPSLATSAYPRALADMHKADLRAFLQAAMDEAWKIGLRPTGHEDNTSELKAVRYHLEDMRALAKVPPRPIKETHAP